MSKPSSPKILNILDSLIKEISGPDAVVASWLLPIFAHIAPVVADYEIPPRVAELSRLVGIELGIGAKPQEE